MLACATLCLAAQLLAASPAPRAPRAAPPVARADTSRRTDAAWPLPAFLPDGRRVEIYPDGRWRWSETGYSPASPWLTDHARPSRATRALDLVPGRLVLWMDPREWDEDLDGRHPDPDTDEGRAPDAWLFEHASGAAFARIAARRTGVPLDVLVDGAVEMLEQGLDDVRVTGETHRRANGLDQLVLEARARWRGEPVFVLDFCWTGPEGSVQIATWCDANDLESLRPALERLADGLARTRRAR